jgi:hypothetical protein
MRNRSNPNLVIAYLLIAKPLPASLIRTFQHATFILESAKGACVRRQLLVSWGSRGVVWFFLRLRLVFIGKHGLNIFNNFKSLDELFNLTFRLTQRVSSLSSACLLRYLCISWHINSGNKGNRMMIMMMISIIQNLINKYPFLYSWPHAPVLRLRSAQSILVLISQRRIESPTALFLRLVLGRTRSPKEKWLQQLLLGYRLSLRTASYPLQSGRWTTCLFLGWHRWVPWPVVWSGGRHGGSVFMWFLRWSDIC